MSLTLIALILTLLLNIALGLVVFLRNPKSNVGRIFLYIAIALSLWTACNYLIDNYPLLVVNQYAAYLAFGFGFLSMNSLLLFTYFFPDTTVKEKWNKWRFWVLTGIFFLISVSPLVVGQAVRRNPTYVDISSGPLYLVFVASLIFMFGLLVRNLIISYRYTRNKKIELSQLRIVILGIVVPLAFGTIANAVLPAFTSLETAKFGPLFTTLLVASFSVAIIRHKLFDIRFVVARSFAYVLAAGLLGVTYGFVAFRFVGVLFTNTSQSFQQGVDVVLAIILAFTFSPLLRYFSKLSNAIFYRGKYDSQQLVTEIGRILAGEIQLDLLCNKVIRELSKQMKITTVDVVVLSEKSVHFQTRIFGNEHHQVVVADLTKLGRFAVIADELGGGEKKQVMQKYGYSVSLALRTSEEFLGYLLLGEKRSGDIYNDEDIQTLKIIANELSVGLQNAKAFAEIQAFNVTLQDKVEQATRSLRKANVQLKELDQAKDEFISMASHQLRTPLTTIKGYVSMLDEGDFGKLTKEQKEYVELALDGSNRMARLIGDLLDVSRMEAGKFYIDAQKFDLNTVVPQELEQLQNMADSKKIDLRYIAPKKPVPIMNLDDNKTRQVIMNLADNAVHYSAPPKGGGKVEVRLERDGDDIVYVVRDNGIGVPKDQQGKLFTKMFRAKNAQEVRPDGTGLGLYLVKRVVEDQGGKLIFESTPGKGSVFGFKIPIHNKIVVDKKAQKALVAAQVSK